MWSVSVLLGLIVLATSRVEIAADGIRRVWYFLFIKRARFLSHESIISIEVKGNRVTIRRYGQLVPLPDIFYIKDRKSFIAAIEKHIPDKLEVKS